jgi:hypothetical protein
MGKSLNPALLAAPRLSPGASSAPRCEVQRRPKAGQPGRNLHDLRAGYADKSPATAVDLGRDSMMRFTSRSACGVSPYL